MVFVTINILCFKVLCPTQEFLALKGLEFQMITCSMRNVPSHPTLGMLLDPDK